MHFVGFIDLRFLFIIIRKVPKDRKVMPGERSSSGSSAHIVVPLGRSPGPTVLPSDSRLTAHILRTPGTRGTREA